MLLQHTAPKPIPDVDGRKLGSGGAPLVLRVAVLEDVADDLSDSKLQGQRHSAKRATLEASPARSCRRGPWTTL